MLFNVFVLVIGVASARHLYEVNEQVGLTERNYANHELNPDYKRRNIQYYEHSFHQIQLNGPPKFDSGYRMAVHPEFFDIMQPHLSRPGEFEAIKRNNEFINNKKVISSNTYSDLREDAKRGVELEITSQQSITGPANDNGGSATQEHTQYASNDKNEEFENNSTTRQNISQVITNKNEQGHDSNKNSSDSTNQYKNIGQETMTSRKIKEPEINQADTSTTKSIVIGGPILYSNKNSNDTNSINNDDGVDETMWVWSSTDGKLETTTLFSDLVNRDAFKGDGCPSDMAKVGGICVTPH